MSLGVMGPRNMGLSLMMGLAESGQEVIAPASTLGRGRAWSPTSTDVSAELRERRPRRSSDADPYPAEAPMGPLTSAVAGSVTRAPRPGVSKRIASFRSLWGKSWRFRYSKFRRR